MKTAERLLSLVQYLDGHRYHSIREIRESFSVTERTVFRDLARIEELKLPLERSREGYRLRNTSGSITLDGKQRALIRLALTTPAITKSPALSVVARALENRLGPADSPNVAAIAGPDRSGTNRSSVRELLERSIESAHSLSIRYASLQSGTRWRGVDPWKLFHRSDAWYLAANCHERDTLRFFRVDRIEAVRESGKRFIRPEGDWLSSALEGSWAIYKGEEEWEIELYFHSDVAPLITHGSHHEGEKVSVQPDGSVEYRVRLSHLEEIARWVLSFGGAARVIFPDQLRTRVVELGEGAISANRDQIADSSETGQDG